MAKTKLKKIRVDNTESGLDMAINKPYSYAPTFSVNDSQISELDEIEPGDKIRLEVEVEMTRKSSMTKNKVTTIDAGFKINAYKIIDAPKDMEDMDDDELKEHIDEMSKK